MMYNSQHVNRSLIDSFEPHVRLQLFQGRYSVKTVDHPHELEQALRLRHEVFCAEYGLGRQESGLDLDEFDSICDHLVIRDERSSQIVGTYRLISSLYSSSFYSETEFDLSGFLSLPGHKLELGRACVHPSFRGGIALHLLWRGLAEYIRITGSKYVFGCSSVKATTPSAADRLRGLLERAGHVCSSHGIRPLPSYQLPHEENGGVEVSGELEVPPLLMSYLKAGAKVCGEPALDREFACLDFFGYIRNSQS
jgi:putative hemolysin